MNYTKLQVTINGTDYTKNTVFPILTNTLLDQQLDECRFSIVQTTTPMFKPYTLVHITATNGTETRAITMYVASDKASEIPVGSGKFNHELQLIEQTKLLETIFVRSHGYVNALARTYAKVAAFPTVPTDDGGQISVIINTCPIQPINYPLDLPSIEIPSVGTLFTDIFTKQIPSLGYVTAIDNSRLTVISDGVEIYTSEQTNYTSTTSTNTTLTITAAQSLKFIYHIGSFYWRQGGSYPYNNDIVFECSASADGTAPQKWTIRSVINRVLDIAIPLRKGEVPRFKLDGDNPLYIGRFDTLEQLNAVPTDTLKYDIPSTEPTEFRSSTAYVGEYGNTADTNGLYMWNGAWTKVSWDKPALRGQALDFEYISAPEFQFTQSSLREILQGIGEFIHGEPRLENGVISYDMYGGQEQAEMPNNYGAYTVTYTADRFASNIDSNVGNLVDSINYSLGTRTEPFYGAERSVRTEAIYARIEEGNMFIATERPINTVISLTFKYNGVDYDLRPYVFEEADYKQMSSWSTAYPYSKAYALYYRRGTKNVQGLNFKIENAINESVFSRYAIINILRAVTGNNNLSINDLGGNYSNLAFNIVYQPLTPARIQQSKAYIGDITEEVSMAYNQGQNIVEAHYYGESMKGLIARLGNADIIMTTAQYGLGKVPKIGTKWVNNNEEYYVTAVAQEIHPTVTKTTIGLTKDFNKYSAYVALDRQKRQYEISERAAYDSFYSYRDYCVIGDIVEQPTPTLFTDGNRIRNIFTQNIPCKPLSVMFLQGTDKYENTLQQVALACQSMAMGNAAVYTASYQDNFSAGTAVSYQASGNVTGYFTNSVPYSDFYGNFEYLKMQIAETATGIDGDTKYTLPSAVGLTASNSAVDTADKPLLVRKGSTEVLNVNYQIDFVTNRKDIIIGSAMAKNLVKGTQDGHAAKLYLLQSPINKFATTVDITNAQPFEYTMQVDGNLVMVDTGTNTTTTTFKAWAFVDGATNELLFGSNREIPPNEFVIKDQIGLQLRHTIK